MINTVLGPIHPDHLGVTYMHEHILIDTFDVTGDSNSRLDDVEIAIEELSRLRDAGGSTVVEVTPINMGRDVSAVREVAGRTGLNVVVGTGIYVERFHPPYVRTLSCNQLADVFIKEAVEGIEGTSIRAGIIGEIGTGKDFISPAEERVLRAAARAHKATGLPISTHAAFGRIALAQIEVLSEEGVDPARIIIGHMDTQPFEEYHLAVARKGVYLQYDTIGRTDLFPDARRVRLVKYMIEKGYVSRLLFSQDVFRRSHLRTFGGPGYDHLLVRFVPMLIQAGIREEDIERILVDNPREVLTPSA